jgi:hypothetical protein
LILDIDKVIEQRLVKMMNWGLTPSGELFFTVFLQGGLRGEKGRELFHKALPENIFLQFYKKTLKYKRVLIINGPFIPRRCLIPNFTPKLF